MEKIKILEQIMTKILILKINNNKKLKLYINKYEYEQNN